MSLTDQDLEELKPYIAGMVAEYVTQLLGDPLPLPAGLSVGQAELTDSGLTLANLADLRELGSSPTAPATGYFRIFSKSDGFHYLSPAGLDLLAILSNDGRLTNARTPTTHTHAPAEVTGTAVITTDGRLSDARTPTAHSHGNTDLAVTWGNYSPAWTAITTNPVLNNGTLVGRYFQLGKLVIGEIALNMGSTTTYGSGAWRFSLPVTPATTLRDLILANAVDASPAASYVASGQIQSGNLLNVTGYNTGGFSVTIPFTWANTDRLNILFIYEAA